MTWKDAIIKTLQENVRNKEYIPMHYKEITDVILNNNLKETRGRTPSLTVSACLTTHPDLFISENGGFYSLTEEGKKYEITSAQNQQHINLGNTREEEQEENDLRGAILHLETGKIIKHYGIFWNREYVNWSATPFQLLGKDSTKSSHFIDFRKMRGIYMLYDFREVVYVGQAMGNNSIANRLKEHIYDRHASRWNRFSWFGIDSLDNDGNIVVTPENLTINLNDLIDALEGLLIEGLEPRQNRQGGNHFGYECYQVIPGDEN